MAEDIKLKADKGELIGVLNSSPYTDADPKRAYEIMLNTKTPEETEMELRKILPVKHWLDINTLLVTHGQNVCKPQRPKCAECPISEYCKKII